MAELVSLLSPIAETWHQLTELKQTKSSHIWCDLHHRPQRVMTEPHPPLEKTICGATLPSYQRRLISNKLSKKKRFHFSIARLFSEPAWASQKPWEKKTPFPHHFNKPGFIQQHSGQWRPAGCVIHRKVWKAHWDTQTDVAKQIKCQRFSKFSLRFLKLVFVNHRWQYYNNKKKQPSRTDMSRHFCALQTAVQVPFSNECLLPSVALLEPTHEAHPLQKSSKSCWP